jgi:quinol monooxygenase YgiN
MKMNALDEKCTELLQTLQSISVDINNDKGCLICSAFQSLKYKNSFCLISEWETQNDLYRHIRSDRFTVLLGAGTLFNRPLEVLIHAVSSTAGMEVVRAVRGNNKGGDNETN